MRRSRLITKYRCKVCCKSRSLSNMDITILKKHMEDQTYFFRRQQQHHHRKV